MSEPKILLLGATGYLGSEFLGLLGREFPRYPVRTMLRNATVARVARLKELHPLITPIEGSHDNTTLIEEEALKADIVINTASSDHWPSVKATLDGLEKSSAQRPGRPPLYIHVSGCGILSDNVRGEKVDNIKQWSDIGLDLNDCPPTNTHLECDIPIVAAGTRKENPVRTIIIFPGQIYGVGRGVQRVTLWLRIFMDFAKQTGYAGTWGPGYNSQNVIHIQDMADIVLFILKAALEGRAEEGANGLYFAVSMEPKVSYREWTQAMGDYMHSKGLLKYPGTRPMPPEIVEPLGNYGWSCLGGNLHASSDRLTAMGWKPKMTCSVTLLETMPEMIDAALHETPYYDVIKPF